MIEDYRLSIAWQYHQRGQHGLAIDQLKELLAHDPEIALAHGLLASCLVSQARITAAEYEIQLALQLDPRESFFFLVRAQIEVFRNHPKRALQFCDEALALHPKFANAYLLKSEIALRTGSRNDAREYLDQAAALEPDNINIVTAYGEFHLKTGNAGKAAAFATQALSMDAQDEDANLLMGEAKLVLGDVADAEYHAKFAITRNPNSQEALRLFSHIKMRGNLFLGLWWRFNSWAATLGNLKSSVVLIGAFLSFNLLAQVLSDLDYPFVASTVSYTWLILVLYSWVGIPMYYRALKRELDAFSFRSDF